MKEFALPLFESGLLHDIASAIERRGKSIRYRGRLECGRAVETPFERLNVNFASPVYGDVSLSIWSDGKLWLSVKQPGPKSAGSGVRPVEVRSHVAEFDGFEVCRRFEQTIDDSAHVRDFWPIFSPHDRTCQGE